MYSKHPLLNQVHHALVESQAIDITVIDVSSHTPITDYMVICSGRSSRHVSAIAEQLMTHLKTKGFPSLNHHGLQTGDWALVDLGDVVVHVMQPATRAFYNIEGLWQHE